MTETARQVQMTESAAKRIQELIASNGASDQMLRLQVSGGGCSGFQLGGAEIDFVRELVGAAFRVNNPNATSSCGCGSSFSI